MMVMVDKLLGRIREKDTAATAVRWVNNDVDTGTETLDTTPAVAAGNAFEWKYRVKQGTQHSRSGTVLAVVTDNGYGVLAVTYKDFTDGVVTGGTASTTQFAFAVALSGGALILQGTAASDNWDARGTRTRIDF